MTDLNFENKQQDRRISSIVKRRLIVATKNSIIGLTTCFKHEEAFRIQVFIAVIALPSIFWVADNVMEGLLLLFVIVLMMITELLNSAVETTVDRIGMDYHELSKRAKDIASAAVFFAILLAAVTWLTLIIT
ncbi:MAG: diacylglycerol kinase [Cellvibrionales bacterium]|jgi:diacylglycerol kinase (ATP)|nr:diacylglycerol kinase [Cellvibrionales bacterium]MBT6579908.1 diacylglycerol kinase [Cellvibrionales bacterium]